MRFKKRGLIISHHMARTSGFSCKSITVYICMLQTDFFFKRKNMKKRDDIFPLTTATSVSFSRGFLVPPRHPSASRSRGVNPHELPMSQVNVRCFSTVAVVASDTWIVLDPFRSRLEGWFTAFFLTKNIMIVCSSADNDVFFSKSGISYQHKKVIIILCYVWYQVWSREISKVSTYTNSKTRLFGVWLVIFGGTFVFLFFRGKIHHWHSLKLT